MNRMRAVSPRRGAPLGIGIASVLLTLAVPLPAAMADCTDAGCHREETTIVEVPYDPDAGWGEPSADDPPPAPLPEPLPPPGTIDAYEGEVGTGMHQDEVPAPAPLPAAPPSPVHAAGPAAAPPAAPVQAAPPPPDPAATDLPVTLGDPALAPATPEGSPAAATSAAPVRTAATVGTETQSASQVWEAGSIAWPLLGGGLVVAAAAVLRLRRRAAHDR